MVTGAEWLELAGSAQERGDERLSGTRRRFPLPRMAEPEIVKHMAGVTEWNEQLAAMAIQWDTAVRAEHRRSEAIVAIWRTRFDQLAERHHELMRTGRWRSGPADFLSVLGRGYHEVHHSSVIAWLCRPEGHHGLGDRFLRRLLAASGPAAEALLPTGSVGPITVKTEVVACGGARADIVITTPVGRLLIENKTGAPEADGQLAAYFGAFADGATEFAFLTPTGRAPSSAGGDAARWSRLSYRQVREALRAALTESDPNARAADVARSYLTCLEEWF